MTISKELLDELLKGCERPEDLLGDGGLMKELKIKLMERMLGAELTAHLGYEDGKDAPAGQANRRNGTSSKRLKGQDGEVPIAVPRDRDGSFEPELVKKGQTRIDGIDDKIVGLYAAGLTVRDIRAHLEDVYGLQVSPDLISRVTDAVLDEVRDWQSRALDRMYPIVIFDALRVKIRDADSRTVKSEPLCRHVFETNGERRLRGPGRHPRRCARGSGPLDRRQRRGEILAVGDERVEEPGGAGRSDRGRGRSQGGLRPFLPQTVHRTVCRAARGPARTPRGHHRRLPGRHGPDMYRASCAPLAELLRLEGSQGRRRRPASDLRRPDGRSGCCRVGRFRRKMGREICLDRPGVAAGVG